MAALAAHTAALTPPNGTRRSRMSHVLTQTMPTSSLAALDERDSVADTLAASYFTPLACSMASASSLNR